MRISVVPAFRWLAVLLTAGLLWANLPPAQAAGHPKTVVRAANRSQQARWLLQAAQACKDTAATPEESGGVSFPAGVAVLLLLWQLVSSPHPRLLVPACRASAIPDWFRIHLLHTALSPNAP